MKKASSGKRGLQGLAAGSLLGAGIGGVRGYRSDEEDTSTGKEALKGGILGGGIGGSAGLASGFLSSKRDYEKPTLHADPYNVHDEGAHEQYQDFKERHNL